MCSATSLTGLATCFCHLPWSIFLALDTLDSAGSGLSDLDFDSLVRADVVASFDGVVVAVVAAEAVDRAAAEEMDVVVERTTFLVVEGLDTVLSAVTFSSDSFWCEMCDFVTTNEKRGGEGKTKEKK